MTHWWNATARIFRISWTRRVSALRVWAGLAPTLRFFWRGCVYSIASFIILRFADKLLIGLFLDAGEVEIMANAQSFIFWNSVFYIPLAVLIIYRYTIQGLGYSGLAMFAGVAEMVARAMVGFLFVPLWGYFAACIANPVAWFFACFFLIPAYFVVRKKLMNEKENQQGHAVRNNL